MVEYRDPLTIVIKLGTSSIVEESTHQPKMAIIASIVDTCVALRKQGHRVVLVSSGAVGVGPRHMHIGTQPSHLRRIQALAAVGQCRLVALWDQMFSNLRQPVAQVLLTRSDIANKTQYVNAQNTFTELLTMGVIPIVNENDTLAVAEIKFGDNDILSAITAAMVCADYLFLLTDVDGLHTSNPRNDPKASVVDLVDDISALEVDVTNSGSSLGTGGMASKITAAELATSAGVTTIITKSSTPMNVHTIVQSLIPSQSQLPPKSIKPETATAWSQLVPRYTRFQPQTNPILSHSFWLLHGITPHGTVYIDEGAYLAISRERASGLLPSGIIGVDGIFGQLEAVRLVVLPFFSRLPSTPSSASLHQHRKEDDYALNGSLATVSASITALEMHNNKMQQREVGRALVNYDSREIALIRGLQSTQIRTVLGYADSEHVAVKKNISLYNWASNSSTTTPTV